MIFIYFVLIPIAIIKENYILPLIKKIIKEKKGFKAKWEKNYCTFIQLKEN